MSLLGIHGPEAFRYKIHASGPIKHQGSTDSVAGHGISRRMERTGLSTTGVTATWLVRVRDTLLHHFLAHIESNVFRSALLTVLLISAVQEFVGWKFAGVVIREAVAHVQREVLPWGGTTNRDRWLVPPAQTVATLQIGNELFASQEGFGHRVPLLPDRLLHLLNAIVERVPAQARIVIDFDLAPRVGEDPMPRGNLDDWLVANAHRLLLVEPSWAARNAETLGRQLEWAWRMCGAVLRPATQKRPNERTGAVFVQSTLRSNFGVVMDSVPLSGKQGPAWDIGRAVANPGGPDGQQRNPICSRLLGYSPAPGEAVTAGPRDPLKLQLVLGKELRRYGVLQIEPQPAGSNSSAGEVVLRSEFIRSDPACEPKRFEDIATLPCLTAAGLVMIGGSWSHGFGDLQDTFVGEADGVVIHAAWIQSWLKPARHLHKVLDILLDVVIIEILLHPMLKFAFVGMRRSSDMYLQQVASAVPKDGLGLHVTVMLLYLTLAVLGFLGTTFALIVLDGLLRWGFDRTLALDTTILALVLWSAIALNNIGSLSQEKIRAEPEAFPVVNAVWLAALCAGSVALAWAAWKLSDLHPSSVPWLVTVGFAAILVGSGWSAVAGHPDPEKRTAAAVAGRMSALCDRLQSLGGSMLRSLDLFGWRKSAPKRGWPTRLADAIGAVLWLAVWAYGFYVLARSTLWGLVLELLKG